MPHALSSGLPKDFLRPCLLLLLREGSAHGYELLESVCAFGFDHSDPGALYRTLRRLEEDGLVQSGWRDSDSGPPQARLRADRRRASPSSTIAPPTWPRASAASTPSWAVTCAPGGCPGSAKRRAVEGKLAAHRAAANGRNGELGPRRSERSPADGVAGPSVRLGV